MDIIRFLKDQHEEVKDVLNKIIVRNDARESRSLLETVSKVLRLHMQIEETFVYPAASRCFQGDHGEPSVLQSLEEHELARRCLATLESTPPTDERFVARAKVLRGILHEHILEEEIDMFPSLATKLGQSGLDKLGNEVERQMSRPAAKSAARPAKRAATKPQVTKSRGAKVAQTRRQRATVRGAKGSRTQASASRSAKRH
jgi:hemerythrin-like domain-containing protein